MDGAWRCRQHDDVVSMTMSRKLSAHALQNAISPSLGGFYLWPCLFVNFLLLSFCLGCWNPKQSIGTQETLARLPAVAHPLGTMCIPQTSLWARLQCVYTLCGLACILGLTSSNERHVFRSSFLSFFLPSFLSSFFSCFLPSFLSWLVNPQLSHWTKVNRRSAID